jgi:hypothetical protein
MDAAVFHVWQSSNAESCVGFGVGVWMVEGRSGTRYQRQQYGAGLLGTMSKGPGDSAGAKHAARRRGRTGQTGPVKRSGTLGLYR